MGFHQCNIALLQASQSGLFLYFGVLTFTQGTSPCNALVRVSKSRNR